MPRYLEPMKATLATKAFRDDDWLFEVKWDGYRVEAVVADGKVSLFTRNGNNAETYVPGAVRRAHRDRGRGVLPGGQGAGARGHRGKATPLAVRGGQALERLAQD